MAIGILGAIAEEIADILPQMKNVSVINIGRLEFYQGLFQTKEIILAFSKVGKVAASTVAATMINHFKIEAILFSGVAGAIHTDLNIGDIVIASDLYQHDMDASPIFEPMEIPLEETKLFRCDLALVQKAQSAANLFLKQQTSIIADKLNTFAINSQPKTVVGPIASGDQFIRDATKRLALSANIPDLKAVEMEGAAVAHACYLLNTPCAVIRVISDNASENAHIDFLRFIKDIAAFYSVEIAKAFFANASFR